MDDVALIESLHSMLDTGQRDHQYESDSIDFSQLEKYICEGETPCFRNLPDSPPDSGSELPLSPENLQTNCATAFTVPTSSAPKDPFFPFNCQYPNTVSPDQAQQLWNQKSFDQRVEPGNSSPFKNDSRDWPFPVLAPITANQNADVHPVCKRPRAISPAPVANNNNVGVLDSARYPDSTDFTSNSKTESETGQKLLQFSVFQRDAWSQLFDRGLNQIPTPYLQLEADKGFNYSISDEAFVCQKKNHFQITCVHHIAGAAYYIQTPSGHRIIDEFRMNFFGVKSENQNHVVIIEQSQSDRSKRIYEPTRLQMPPYQKVTTTVGRLHFSETTSNNMRKKGRPNPDQRFFNLVISVEAQAGGQWFPLVQLATDKLIVRASNPGQFESDAEPGWQKGSCADSLVHTGRVGVNVEAPSEALHVHGNMRLTGHLYNPSDERIKSQISELDTKQQLSNVQKLRVVKYDYDEGFAESAGLRGRADTGVIAQEVKSVLPDAVVPAGDLLLPDGKLIDDLLVVNKERIFMENLGAVKELCKVTDTLETRIQGLERVNRRLVRLKRHDSVLSSSSISTITSLTSSFLTHMRNNRLVKSTLLQKKAFQASVLFVLVALIVSLVTMTTLYVIENRLRYDATSDLQQYLIADGNNSTGNDSFSGHVETNRRNFMDGSISNATSQKRTRVIEAILAQKTDSGNGNVLKDISASPGVENRPQTPDLDGMIANISSMNLSSGVLWHQASTRLKTDTSEMVDNSVYHSPDVSMFAFDIESFSDRGTVLGADRMCAARGKQTGVERCQVFCCGDFSTGPRGRNEPMMGLKLRNGMKSFKNDHIMMPQKFFARNPRENREDFRASQVMKNIGHRSRAEGSYDSMHLTEVLGHGKTRKKSNSLVRLPVIKHKPLPGLDYVEKMSFDEYPDVVLDGSYCERSAQSYNDCVRGVGGNITLKFTVSKYMAHEDLHLRLQYADRLELAGQPVHCNNGERGERSCSLKTSASTEKTVSPADGAIVSQISSGRGLGYLLRLDVGRWEHSDYTFRIALVQHDKTSPCSLPEKFIQKHFIELKLIFERVCDE